MANKDRRPSSAMKMLWLPSDDSRFDIARDASRCTDTWRDRIR